MIKNTIRSNSKLRMKQNKKKKKKISNERVMKDETDHAFERYIIQTTKKKINEDEGMLVEGANG